VATRAGTRAVNRGWIDHLIAGAAIALFTLTLTALSFGFAPATDGEKAMSLPLVIHLATVLPALPLGAYILMRPKGGGTHRLLGRIWAALMMTTAISSFWLQDSGGLSFIHIFAVVTLVSIPLSVFWIRRGDVVRHRRAMTNTYIGLVVAGLFALAPGRLLGSWLFG
jgi:uncharacterized membrane protein